jgi:hypothetical protein
VRHANKTACIHEVMRRTLFTLASAVSLLLCIAAAFLWIRGHWVQDRLFLRRSTITWDLASIDGALRFSRVEDWHDRPRSPHDSPGFRLNYFSEEQVLGDGDLSFEGSASSAGWQLLGFVFCPTQVSDRPTMTFATLYIIPLWSIVLVTLPLPMIWLRPMQRLRQWRRGRQGSCPTCSYNLKGNASGVCPECGSKIAACHIVKT